MAPTDQRKSNDKQNERKGIFAKNYNYDDHNYDEDTTLVQEKRE